MLGDGIPGLRTVERKDGDFAGVRGGDVGDADGGGEGGGVVALGLRLLVDLLWVLLGAAEGGEDVVACWAEDGMHGRGAAEGAGEAPELLASSAALEGYAWG